MLDRRSVLALTAAAATAAAIRPARAATTVRKAMEDQVQALLSAKVKPLDAAQNAQKAAEELLKPYVQQTAMKFFA